VVLVIPALTIRALPRLARRTREMEPAGRPRHG
jgi:hypothetical protein